jgi:hypothetical protein
MTIAYFDCYNGISGDMTLGALVDAGLDFEALKSGLTKLNVGGFELRRETVNRSGIRATKIDVVVHEDEEDHRNLAEVYEIVDAADLPERVKARSREAFRRIGEAEAFIHRKPLDTIHFHEVGCIDAIVDVMGAMLGVELLGIERVFCSPIAVGQGTVECRHGILPVPAPATLRILQGVPIYSGGIDAELATPTGAAIITTLAERFGPMPVIAPSAIGYGAGSRQFEEHTNCLRLILGAACAGASDGGELALQTVRQTLYRIETEIDDMNPELFSSLLERLFELGVLDAHWIPVQMKKNRPGVALEVLTDLEHRDAAATLLFRETSTFGLRVVPFDRYCLRRSFDEVATRFGPVRVKIGYWGEAILKVTPEYESCRRAALANQVPVARVYQAAIAAIEARFFGS